MNTSDMPPIVDLTGDPNLFLYAGIAGVTRILADHVNGLTVDQQGDLAHGVA
jgi:hypothetical protein